MKKQLFILTILTCAFAGCSAYAKPAAPPGKSFVTELKATTVAPISDVTPIYCLETINEAFIAVEQFTDYTYAFEMVADQVAIKAPYYSPYWQLYTGCLQSVNSNNLPTALISRPDSNIQQRSVLRC